MSVTYSHQGFLSRDQFSWDQLPCDQLSPRSTYHKIHTHEINLSWINSIFY